MGVGNDASPANPEDSFGVGSSRVVQMVQSECLGQTKEGFLAGELWGGGVVNVGVEMCRRWVLDLSYRTNIRWQWVGDSQADTVGA